MKINSFLEGCKSELFEQWQQQIVDTYPKDSNKFFLGVKDQFANPIGHTLSEKLPIIIDALAAGKKTDELTEAIEAIVRIRAVQDFSPSQAVQFVDMLREIVIGKAIADSSMKIKHAIEINSRISAIEAIAIDKYVDMREKLFEIKANEVRKRTSRMIDRLNRKYDKLDTPLPGENL